MPHQKQQREGKKHEKEEISLIEKDGTGMSQKRETR